MLFEIEYMRYKIRFYILTKKMSAFKIAVIAVFCFSLQVVDGQDDFGFSHSCAVSCSDNVICWGDNRFGQLGSDDNMTTMNHVHISNVVQISAGAIHTCALKNDSTVACWGNNRFGQLGNSLNNGTKNSNLIPLIVNIENVKQISAGAIHTCALKNDGSVFCWGFNKFGQLGNSTNIGLENSTTVTPLNVNINNVKQISAGKRHTCALKNNGTVSCWGINRYGQLGNSANTIINYPNSIPVDVNIDNVKQISAGGIHTCALKNDGTVACWGWNMFGQLGNEKNIGSTNPNFTPLDVSITEVKQISADDSHTCALKTDSTIWCWGIKFTFGNGQILNFSNFNFYTNIPEKMANTQEENIVQVTAGSYCTCILYDTKEVYCTGLYDIDDPNRTFSFQKDKNILLYNTATDVAFLAERNDENICSNTKDDDPKLSVPAIVGIVLGSVLLCGGILYFILKGPIGKKMLGIGRYVQLTA